MKEPIKRRILRLILALLAALNLIGCAGTEVKFDLSGGEVTVDSALMLGMPEASIPEEWRSLSGFPVDCAYAGIEWQAKLNCNDEGFVNGIICTAKNHLSREEVTRTAEQLERDYGLTAVCAEPMGAGLRTFTMDEGQCRVRLREEHQYSEDRYLVTMTYRIMPLDPYRSEAPFR